MFLFWKEMTIVFWANDEVKKQPKMVKLVAKKWTAGDFTHLVGSVAFLRGYHNNRLYSPTIPGFIFF